MNFPSLLMAAVLVATASVQADTTTLFTAPPFKLNQSIVGIEGWEPRLATSPPDGGARLVEVRWDDYQPAVVLDGAALKKTFDKTTGDKIQVRLQLAITFPDETPKLQQIRFGFPGTPFREIVFEGSAEGGLGFGNGTGRGVQVLVPVADLKPNSYYTLTVTSDNASATSEARVTGTKRDGSPLDITVKDLAFEGMAPNALSSVFIISATNIRAYLKEISVTSL